MVDKIHLFSTNEKATLEICGDLHNIRDIDTVAQMTSLAHVLVNKYADHLPLYRQSQIFAREGIDLGRSTLTDWVGSSTALLEPLADAIGRHVLRGDAIFADDTPVKVLTPGAGKTKTARLWAYARDERPWAGDAPPAAWYQFSTDRKAERPRDHLQNFEGWMHADGYAGFEELYRSGKVHEVACMAHIRRKFVDVQHIAGPQSAAEIAPGVEHRSHKGLNNRAENSHLPFRRREGAMQGYRSPGSLQRFVSIHSAIRNCFSVPSPPPLSSYNSIPQTRSI